MADCVIGMKSPTLAEQARRIAAHERIPAEVVSIDPTVTRRGCSFGLRLNCGDAERLSEVLRARNVPFGDIIGKAGR